VSVLREEQTKLGGRENLIFTFVPRQCRILDEKREAFDTIELLKLIGKHQGSGRQGNSGMERPPFSPSSSTTSLSTMSSFSSNNQQ
jgi:hypothetical protein